MPTTHKGTSRVLDELLLCFDAVATASEAQGTVNGTGVDLGVANDDEAGPQQMEIKWPGILGAASSTVQFLLEDGATLGGSYATILSTIVVDTDGTEAFNPADHSIPIPNTHRQFVRLSFVVGTADLAAGSGPITAGVTRGPSGGN